MTWFKRYAPFVVAAAVLAVLAISAGADFYGSSTSLDFYGTWF
jgi:hypothetical protein